MLLGTYEQDKRAVVAQRDAVGLRLQLLPHDLDRIAPSLERRLRPLPGRRRRPASRSSSTARSRSAPTATRWSARSGACAQCWVACAVMAGLSQGGGVGLSLANWMIDGDPQRRHLGHGRRPLRRLGHARLHQRQGARELLAGGSGSRSPTRSCRRRGRCTPRRSTTGSPSTTRCGAPAFGLEHPLWFQRPGRGAGRGRHVPPLQRVPAGGRGVPGRARAGRADGGSNFAKYRVSGRRAPPTGCRACSPTACRRSAASP